MKSTTRPQFEAKLTAVVKDRQCVFLVGAGVSMLGPTALPSGPELKNIVITRLFEDVSLFTRQVKRLKASRKYRTVVPEIVFQQVFQAVGNTLSSCFDVLEDGSPNLAHHALAQLAATHGAKLFTTNFETLIEKSTPTDIKVIHLHGSLDDRAQMHVRINQVGRGLPGDLARRFIRELRKSTLVVCGYSGNDKDIMDPFDRQSGVRKGANPLRAIGVEGIARSLSADWDSTVGRAVHAWSDPRIRKAASEKDQEWSVRHTR